jgi:hypothetical protein
MENQFTNERLALLRKKNDETDEEFKQRTGIPDDATFRKWDDITLSGKLNGPAALRRYTSE